jgi:hypothetical protein
LISDPSQRIGHIAEHYVCYDLSRRGIRVALSPFEQAPYDIIADYHGTIFTVQVKGTQKPNMKINGQGRGYPVYLFKFSDNLTPRCDILAYVALDTEKICYHVVKDHKCRTTSKWISTHIMTMGDDSELLAYMEAIAPSVDRPSTLAGA